MSQSPFRTPSGPRATRLNEAETLVEQATIAAERFVETYYKAANTYRSSLATYYVAPRQIDHEKSVPSIAFNGNELRDGNAVQELFEKHMPKSHLEIEVVDCHILNPNYQMPAGLGANVKSNSGLISILVVVGGTFKASDGRDEEEEDFSESFIIVPNPESPPHRGARGPPRKDYLIETQTFRVVSEDDEQHFEMSMAE